MYRRQANIWVDGAAVFCTLDKRQEPRHVVLPPPPKQHRAYGVQGLNDLQRIKGFQQHFQGFSA